MEITIINEYTKDNKVFRTLLIDNLHAECEVIDGRLNGLCECSTVDLNDNLKRIVLKRMYFKDDILDGDFTIYTMKGLIIQEGSYKNGQLHGVVKRYNTLGDLTYIKMSQEFKNGKLHGVTNTYNSLGKINCVNNYKDDKLHGRQVVYNNNGVPTMTYNYLNGLLIDDYNIYNSFGDMISSYHYNIFEGVSIGYNKKEHTIKFQSLPIALDVELVCSLLFSPSTIDEIHQIMEIEYEDYETLKSIVNSRQFFVAFFKTMEKQNVKLTVADFE